MDILVPKPSLSHNCVPKYNLGTRIKDIGGAGLCARLGHKLMVRGTHPTGD